MKRKRPGTLGVCALIQNKYDVDAVPHVLCNGFTQQETEDFLIELRYLGIDNVLAIRGDDSGYRKPLTRRPHAATPTPSDLIRADLGDERAANILDAYLDAVPTEFCVGCSGLSREALRSRRTWSQTICAEREGKGRSGRRVHRDPDVLRQ